MTDLLNLQQIQAYFGWSRSTLYRKIKAGLPVIEIAGTRYMTVKQRDKLVNGKRRFEREAT